MRKHHNYRSHNFHYNAERIEEFLTLLGIGLILASLVGWIVVLK